jgi:hypothetical protein
VVADSREHLFYNTENPFKLKDNKQKLTDFEKLSIASEQQKTVCQGNFSSLNQYFTEAELIPSLGLKRSRPKKPKIWKYKKP